MTTNSVDPRGNRRRCENKPMSTANVGNIYQIILQIRVCAVRVEHALVLTKMASNIRYRNGFDAKSMEKKKCSSIDIRMPFDTRQHSWISRKNDIHFFSLLIIIFTIDSASADAVEMSRYFYESILFMCSRTLSMINAFGK